MKVRLPLIRKVREPDDGDKLEILEKNKVRGQRREVPPGSMVLWRDTPRETVVEPGDMVIIDIVSFSRYKKKGRAFALSSDLDLCSTVLATMKRRTI